MEGPDGATPEQAKVELDRLLAEEKSASEADMQRIADPRAGLSNLEGVAIGAGASVDRAIRGVTGLFGADNTEGKEDAELYRKHHPGTAATVGEVGGDIAMSVAPLVGPGGRLLQATKALGRFAPAAADIAYNVGYNALTAPEDRGMAAALGGAGATAGRVLNRAVGGAVRPSAAGQAMMDKGVRLTPGQAGEGMMGKAAKGYERILETQPVVSMAVEGAKKRAVQDWNKVIGVGADVADTGLPKGTVKIKSIEELAERAAELSEKVAPNSQVAFLRTTGEIERTLESGLDAKHYREAITDPLAKAMELAKKNGQDSLYEAYKTYGNNLATRLSRPVRKLGTAESLRNAATQAQEGRVLKKAAGVPGEPIYPEAIAKAADGTPKLLQESTEAMSVLGKKPNRSDWYINNASRIASLIMHGTMAGMTWPVSTAVLGSSLGATAPGSKFILGQYGLQKKLAAHPELVSKVLRAVATEVAEEE